MVATDHAPHLWSEKEGSCLKAASGGPLVQHSLVAMMQMVKQGVFTLEKLVEKMCHAPADLFRVENRGYIRSGYQGRFGFSKPKSLMDSYSRKYSLQMRLVTFRRNYF